jgi:hypothetical protein
VKTVKKLRALACLLLVVVCLLTLTTFQSQAIASYGALLERMGGGWGWGLALAVGGVVACATVGSVSGGVACGLVIAG